MARYNPGMEDISAGFVILSAGDYAFQVGEAKVFKNIKKNEATGADESNWGVAWNLSVVEAGNPKFIKENIYQRGYLHTEPSVKMTKGFVMTTLGFNPLDKASEAEFNAKYKGEDWMDGDELTCGQMYHDCAGRMVRANVTVKANNYPGAANPEQNQFRWQSF